VGGGDTLAVMSTGQGKPAIYQIAKDYRAEGATTARREPSAAKSCRSRLPRRAPRLGRRGYDDGRVTVLFDEVGYRALALELVAERDLHAADEA
jgi:hypothetical protein